MKEFFVSMDELWSQYIETPIRNMGIWDIVDVVLLAILLYGVYLFFRGRRAGKLALGVAVILVLYAVSNIVGLRAIHSIIEGIAPFTVILVAIVFQNDIRDVLERIGSTPFGFLSSSHQSRADLTHVVNEVVEAACQIAMSDGDGALIAIECTTPLGEHVDKGYPIDATVSAELLRNIFVNKTPLHDGAVIIRHNRIAAAGSKLLLSDDERVVGGLGTRHRAAVGITGASDCVVVVVSEERHVISIANHGLLKRDYNRNAEELRVESNLKATQNQLRNDLFLILAGIDYDSQQAAEAGKKIKKERTKVRFRFRWKRDDDEQVSAKK